MYGDYENEVRRCEQLGGQPAHGGVSRSPLTDPRFSKMNSVRRNNWDGGSK